jgi:hypothetical protein
VSIILFVISVGFELFEMGLVENATSASNKPVHDNDFCLFYVLDSLFLEVQFLFLTLKTNSNKLLMGSIVLDEVIGDKGFADVNDSILVDDFLCVVFLDVLQIQVHVAEFTHLLQFLLFDFGN